MVPSAPQYTPRCATTETQRQARLQASQRPERNTGAAEADHACEGARLRRLWRGCERARIKDGLDRTDFPVRHRMPGAEERPRCCSVILRNSSGLRNASPAGPLTRTWSPGHAAPLATPTPSHCQTKTRDNAFVPKFRLLFECGFHNLVNERVVDGLSQRFTARSLTPNHNVASGMVCLEVSRTRR